MVILKKNSQFEVCLTVSLDISGSLPGVSYLAKIMCRKRAAIRVVFLRTMVTKATRTVIIIWNPRHQQFFHPLIEKSRVRAILYSRDTNYKAYNYYKVAGGNLLNKYFCYVRNAALLNEYSFLE